MSESDKNLFIIEPKEVDLDRSLQLYEIRIQTLISDEVTASNEIYQEIWPEYFIKDDTGEPVYPSEDGRYLQIKPQPIEGTGVRYVKFKEGSPSDIQKSSGSRIYKLYDQKLGRTVAGKTVDYPNQAQTLYEARETANYYHPNISTIHDLAMTNFESGFNNVYMITEWLDGGDLYDWSLEKHTPLELARVLEQISAGIGEINSHNRVYADLKPGNVMFDSQGNVKIIDLGITDIITESGTANNRGANLDFAPPEQLMGYKITKAVDVYAFGALTFYLLTGKDDPYLRKLIIKDFTEYEVIPKIKENFKELIDSDSETLKNLFTVIARSLNKEPGKRYEDVVQMNVDIQLALEEIK